MCEKSATARSVARQNNGLMASNKPTDLRKTFDFNVLERKLRTVIFHMKIRFLGGHDHSCSLVYFYKVIPGGS
mgnify:CR=1 FL=1|jgi:hypothetical protein